MEDLYYVQPGEEVKKARPVGIVGDSGLSKDGRAAANYRRDYGQYESAAGGSKERYPSS
jgi:hypothetical protein